MMRSWSVALMMGFPVAVHAQASPSDSAVVATLEGRIEKATMRGDVAFLDSVYAPSFRFKHSTGDLEGRAARLAAIRARTRPVFARDLDSLDVEVHGEIALTTGRIHVRQDSPDPRWREYTIRYARVYVRRAGRWQLLTHHSTGDSFGPLVSFPSTQIPNTASAGLPGAWLLVETKTTTRDSTWVDTSPQPGLYVFTDKHFSLMLIPQDTLRVLPRENASSAQKLAAYENFIADAGSYEASDSILTMQNFIAKEPYAMQGRPGAGSPYHYRLSGDSLTLTFRRAWAAPGEITYRLIRLK